MQVENINKRNLLKNLKAIIDDDVPLIANLSNISRLLEKVLRIVCGVVFTYPMKKVKLCI